MLDLQQIEAIRATIRSVLEQCEVPYKVTPYDHDLHQECIDEALRRGYPMEGDLSVLTFLRVGVTYAATGGRHLNRPTQIWLALYTSCITYVDEIPTRFPSDIPDIYLFADRFFGMKKQGNPTLDALADVFRQVPDLFLPIPSKLIMTSSLNFITANLLEYETESMQISSTAQRYPIYQRTMTALAEGFAYFAFPPEIPLTDYVQAIPEVMLLINDMNDVLSFYKEELAGETVNQISTLAAGNKESHLKAFESLSDIAVGHYRKIMKILEGYPQACEAFKHFGAGYIDFHVSSERYKLGELFATPPPSHTV